MGKNLYRKKQIVKTGVQKKLDAALSVFIILVLLPLFVTIFYQRMQLEELIGKSETTVSENTAVEEKIAGIVAKEINMNSAEEAIKAQCVIARTNLYAALENGTAEPEEMEQEEMEMLWGSEYEAVRQKLQNLVSETGEQTLKYRGKYIYAAYHAVSAGNTRNMSELYPEADMPYLTGVACHEDTMAENYMEITVLKEKEFLTCCRDYFPEADIVSAEDVAILETDSNGYVLKVKTGQTVCDGETFRNIFSLRSSDFSITVLDGNVRIVTFGLGHGLGLSQYTAEKMAEEGKSYEEILEYFFPGTEITE